MASRFVSEKSVQEAQERRKQEWAETYERLGQKPPEEMPEEKYDPRSLYEKLQEQKDKKQEDFEERIKFKNQFRGIDDEEAAYLADVSAEKFSAEQARQDEIDKELAAFREQKMTVKPVEAPPQASTSKSPQAPPAASGGGSSSSAVTKPPKKQKKTLKGVVVNKKPEKNTSSSSGALSTQSQSLDPSGVPAKRKQAETDTIDEKAPSTTAQSAKQSKKTKTDEPL